MWTKGKRRNNTDSSRFIEALVAEFGVTETARRAGCNAKTVYRWLKGTDRPADHYLMAIAESFCIDDVGGLPIYSPDMAIDGNTRVLGVGEYTIMAARGERIGYDNDN